ALIRYPHGGTFEIPILKVNNKQADGRAIIGNTAADAIGINAKVAERLSGADFDGDTVMVIPCNSGTSKIKITSRLKNGTDLPEKLKALEGFDPKMAYPERSGMKYMKYEAADDAGYKKTVDYTQREMGTISNLLTDMTLRGAVDEELVRAVKHSMVVID
ncbi:MAG: helix-turn-helix domain-containing protein, partial [Clostridia bacterium]